MSLPYFTAVRKLYPNEDYAPLGIEVIADSNMTCKYLPNGHRNDGNVECDVETYEIYLEPKLGVEIDGNLTIIVEDDDGE